MNFNEFSAWYKEQESRCEHMTLSTSARLKREKLKLEKRIRSKQPIDKILQKLEVSFNHSIDLVKQKHDSIPDIVFPENLPISQKQEEIAELIEKNQVVILAGETGSGKTTQIPKICLSLGRGVRGQIGHTQPRRIAARTVAARIAEELQTELGTAVGYQVRFTDHSTENSYVKLMTDGILLAEIQQDPMLWKYDTLIIDEAHERSLNIDFLLGYLKTLLKKRTDLKLIVTSATIDLDKFSKHFDDAPVIEVSGRTYPVDVLYRPWQEQFEDQTEAIVAAIDELLKMSKGLGGDILVFLSGEREIRETSHAIKKAGLHQIEVLPLYARLSLAEQTRIFHPHKGRRVVLATNVAETSLTVPGIRYVIDPGTARISRYSLRTKVQRLPIEAISQASANQRKGRCGRVSDGVCIRLYDKEDFESRPEFTDAEILRTNLAAVVLQMLQMRIGDVRRFPFVDRPDNRLINDGFKLLEELQAVDRNGNITQVGRQLQNISVDPRLARVVIEANKRHCLKEALIIVSALSIQDPRERPADKQQASDEKHRRFYDENSDFFAYINLWNYIEEQRQELSQNQLRKLCKKEFLNYLRLKEWRDLHYQLKLSTKQLCFKENEQPASYEELHRAIISGFITNVGCKQEDKKDHTGKLRKNNTYEGTRNRNFQIFPGSSQYKKRPKWMLAANFLETSQLFSHCVGKIEPEWVLDGANHLIKHHYFEPHYDAKEGQVKAFVKLSLFGLVLIEKKRVQYGKIDEKVSREVFIRSALVEGGYGKSRRKVSGEFFLHNQRLIDEIQELEAKTRRKDILVDEEVLYQFYEQRIPEGIVNLIGFEHWRKTVEQKNPKLLFFTKETLMLHNADGVTTTLFPAQLNYEGMTFPVGYQFNPGHQDDGVNAYIPVALLHEIPEHYLEWLVPGLLRDKCIALVKGLPKPVRRKLVPVPDYVDKIMPRMSPCNQKLTEVLAYELNRVSDANIKPEDWDESCLDNLYLMNVQVLDERGMVIDRDRNLERLKSKYRKQVQQTLKKAGHSIEKESVTTWDFGELHESIQLDRGAVKVTGYPALVDHKTHVSLRVMDNPFEARYENLRGLTRLAYLQLGQTVKYCEKELLRGKDMGLTVVDLGKRADVVDDMIMASIRELCFPEAIQQEVRNEAEFSQRVQSAKASLYETASDKEKVLVDALKSVVEIKKALKSTKNALAIALTAGDVSLQIDRLFSKGFMYHIPAKWFQQYPRYLKAISVRIEKAPMNLQKDRVALSSITDHWQRHADRLAKEGESAYAHNEEWQEYRWMIEELRVSVFAQTLRTIMPVSDKRLNKQWTQSCH
ncbi:ATP-dependent RNA helicase HrpA [Teredinibacter sp. KSP-S5-2]|nr:ATP-dependent RNA helicase HrpA [Teredinibacter sp. KSP-S5-2]WNO09886.1 ATP-dependent RNA helicase HrpA [Teredinibacter sp. KSP-S5-2]